VTTTSIMSHRRINSPLRFAHLDLSDSTTLSALLFTRNAKNITSGERLRTEPSMLVMTDHHRPSRMVLHLQNIYSSLARQLLQRFLSPARQYTTLASTLISTLTIHPQLATKGLTTICTPAPGPPLGLTQAMPHRTMAPFLATIMPFIKLKRSLIHMVNPKRLDSQTLTSQ
jgi:hypothetical protein